MTRRTTGGIPPGLMACVPVLRERHGHRSSIPMELYWSPSTSVVGGFLTLIPERQYPTQYLVVEQTVDVGRLWVLVRRDTGETHHVRREAHRIACDCRGFVSRKYCRHSDALAFLDSEGFLEIIRGLYLAV